METKQIAQINDMEASLAERFARTTAEVDAAYAIGYEHGLHFEGKCAELVMVPTEDGMVDGRCLAPLTTKLRPYKGYCDTEVRMELLPMCDGHADQRSHESHISEAEWAWLERQGRA